MGFQFDVSEVPPASGGFELLEPGDYRLEASEISDEQATKDGTGAYVTIKYSVIEGEREGAQIFSNYNIKNKNPKAEEIAWRELSALGHAVGVLSGDSDALLYKPFLARIGIEKSKDPQYKDKNKIDKFYPQGDAPVAAVAAAPKPAVVAARPAVVATGGTARPWAKRA